MTKGEALKLALEALELTANKFQKQREAITAIEEALAQQCVCGEPNSAGTHRTDGPCLAPQPEQIPPSVHSNTHQPEQEQIQPDKVCIEDDGCPTEKAVLQRFWREHQKTQPEQEPVAEYVGFTNYPQTEDDARGFGKVKRLKFIPLNAKLYTISPQRKPQNAKDFEDYCKTLHPLWNTRISRTEAEGFFHAGWLAAHGIKGEQ